jgi:hypothetical protein
MNTLEKIFYGIALSVAILGFTTYNPVYAADGETTKVCVDVKDAKGTPVKDAKGNVKQTCKTMKVHKKLEGTDVPVKK